MAIERKYQCGSCEKFFDESKDGHCPHCGSGNFVKGCIDEPDLVTQLRQLAEKAAKQGYTNFTLPNTPVDTWGKDDYPENEIWVKCDVGYVLRFIADMME